VDRSGRARAATDEDARRAAVRSIDWLGVAVIAGSASKRSSDSVRLLFAFGQTAEHLEDHAKIALGAEVSDLDAAELTA
jgi:hypothetical protein